MSVIWNQVKGQRLFTGSGSNIHNNFALKEFLVTKDRSLIGFCSWNILQHQPVNLSNRRGKMAQTMLGQKNWI